MFKKKKKSRETDTVTFTHLWARTIWGRDTPDQVGDESTEQAYKVLSLKKREKGFKELPGISSATMKPSQKGHQP